MTETTNVTPRKTAFTRDEWLPLPGAGWVLLPDATLSDENQHLIPRLRQFWYTQRACFAFAPMEVYGLMPYVCGRLQGHTGRHAAALPRDQDTGEREVIAVWGDEPYGVLDVESPWARMKRQWGKSA